MANKITLYNNACPFNRVYKASYLESIGTYNCIIKTPSSIVDPIIELKYSGVFNANYAYISEFKRYYYITDVISSSNNMWTLTLHVDVLMSNYTNIFNLNAEVIRNEYQYDEYLSDEEVPIDFKPEIKKYNFSGTNILANCISPQIDKCTYVLNYITHYPQVDDQVLSTNGSAYVGGRGSHISPPTIESMALTYEDVQKLNIDLCGINGAVSFIQNPSDAIVSLICLPFEIPTSWFRYYKDDGSVYPRDQIRIMDVTLSKTTGRLMKKEIGFIFDIGSVKLTNRTDFKFLDYSPYSYYQAYIPFVGFVDLDPRIVLNTEIHIKYAVDVFTGQANAFITDKSTNILYSFQCTLGTNVPFGKNNLADVAKNILRTSTNTVSNVGSHALSSMNHYNRGVASSIGGFPSLTATFGTDTQYYKTGLVNSAIRGAINGVNNSRRPLYNMYTGFSDVYSNSDNRNGGFESRYAPLIPFIRVIKPVVSSWVTDNIAGFNTLKGRRINKRGLLKNFDGFTVVGDVIMDGFPSCLNCEISEIESLLHSGVFLL